MMMMITPASQTPATIMVTHSNSSSNNNNNLYINRLVPTYLRMSHFSDIVRSFIGGSSSSSSSSIGTEKETER